MGGFFIYKFFNTLGLFRLCQLDGLSNELERRAGLKGG